MATKENKLINLIYFTTNKFIIKYYIILFDGSRKLS